MKILKRVLAIVLFVLVVLLIVVACIHANAESNPSVEYNSVHVTNVVAVSKTGETTVMPSNSYSMTAKEYSEIMNAKNLGSVVSNLNDVAKSIDKSYNSSVFVPVTTFDLDVSDEMKALLAQGYYVAVTFDLGTQGSEDGKYAIIHKSESTGKWEALNNNDVHTSEDGKSVEAYFDGFCPVAILAVNASQMTTSPNIVLYVAGGVMTAAVLFLVITIFRKKEKRNE